MNKTKRASAEVILKIKTAVDLHMIQTNQRRGPKQSIIQK